MTPYEVNWKAQVSPDPKPDAAAKRQPKELPKVGKKAKVDRKQLDDATPAVRARSGGRCEVVIDFERCQQRAFHRHHIVRRSQGGSNDADNLLHVCEAHHAEIHANPVWSIRRGYLRNGAA